MRGMLQVNVTVGFLYGAGAETLIVVTSTSGITGNFVSQSEKQESGVYTQKTKRNTCLGIRC